MPDDQPEIPLESPQDAESAPKVDDVLTTDAEPQPLPPELPAVDGDPFVDHSVAAELTFAESASDNEVWLTDDDFKPALSTPVSIPGPGLLESAGWILGFIVVQIFAGIVMSVIVVLVHGFGLGTDSPWVWQGMQGTDLRKLMSKEYLGLTMGGMQIIMMRAVIGAALIRLGNARFRLLPLKPVAWRHLLLIGLTWIPLAMLCGHLNLWANDVWNMFVEHFPAFDGLSDQTSMRVVKEMVGNTSFAWIILGVAIGPAIGEELVFRGIIGRGLVARWGLPAGIAMTSILFAAVHVQPAHVVSLLPLAIFLHVAHIATRSIWAPILLHFLNNLLAVAALSAINQPEVQEAMKDAPGASPWIIGAGAILFGVMLKMLWTIRLQYYHLDGPEWTPGYATAERPPADIPLRAHAAETPTYLLLLAVLSFLLFLAAMVTTAVMR